MWWSWIHVLSKYLKHSQYVSSKKFPFEVTYGILMYKPFHSLLSVWCKLNFIQDSPPHDSQKKHGSKFNIFVQIMQQVLQTEKSWSKTVSSARQVQMLLIKQPVDRVVCVRDLGETLAESVELIVCSLFWTMWLLIGHIETVMHHPGGWRQIDEADVFYVMLALCLLASSCHDL
jgi:hypothetical protein